MRKRSGLVLAAVVGANAAIAFGVVTSVVGQTTVPSPPRQANVEQRGMTVMPFDQERTMHMFRQSPTGGAQTVLSKDGDSAQIEAIRSHLRHEAARFARGDYSDPIAIHGAQMPGLAVLKGASRDMRVAYAELPEGAEMTFTTNDPTVVKALHDWLAAQVRDHGSHAMMMK